VEVEFQGRFILVRADTLIDDLQLTRTLDRIRRHPLMDSKKHVLLDLRSVTTLNLNAVQVKEYAEGIASINESVRLALVASSDLVFGMARLFQARVSADHQSCKVFQDYHRALAWIERP